MQDAWVMSVSALFVLDVKGRILIYRDYRGDVSTKFAERFMSKVNESEDSGKLSPVLHDEGVTYIYLQHSNVYLLAVTRQNVNATAVMVFLHRLVEMFKYYFEAVEEESIRDNFVTVYELLDEVRAAVAGDWTYVCGLGWWMGQLMDQQKAEQQWQQQQYVCKRRDATRGCG